MGSESKSNSKSGSRSFSKVLSIVVFLILVVLTGCVPDCESRIYEKLLSTAIYAADQYTRVLEHEPTLYGRYPHTAKPNSPNWDDTTDYGGWTAGFYPGVLWQLHRLSGGERKWSDAAMAAQEALRARENDTGTHDVGFVIMSSFGRGLDSGFGLDNATRWEDVIVRTAHSLCTRFIEKAGVLRSWNSGNNGQAVVIVDNMMNLDLLFTAQQISGNSTFGEIALSHADRTIENHFRPDASTFHVVAYSEVNGTVLSKYTAQGYLDNSTWARGQAWAILGYVETYKWTLEPKYLFIAQRSADYFLGRLPQDFIPYWDFDAGLEAGTSYQPRDTSAASIVAYALLQLYKETDLDKYLEGSEKIVESLIENYNSRSVDVPAISINGTVHLKDHKSDTAIIYGDFYLLKYIEYYFHI